MPEYPVFEVQLLLEAMARKAGVIKFDKGGFEEISQHISEGENPLGVPISPRYLKEQLYNKLQKAVEDEKPVISISQDYIDTLSYFLNFQSFNSFQHAVKVIQKALLKISLETDKPYDVAIVHHSDDLSNLEETRQLLAQKDCKVLWLNTDLGETLHQRLKEVSLAIVILSNKLTITVANKLLPEIAPVASAPFFLYTLTNSEQPITPTLAPEWQEKPVLDRFNLPLVLSLLKAILESRLPPQTTDSDDTSKGFTSEDSGTIIQGNNTRIRGKYISGRDMHIVINKQKKDE